ncbi:MAG: ribosome assembly RNA-binding protein YhbY [Eubacteriales bacterium]|nr:ribosome assembly RNA-binding protein YhbY [Eubacteriales bacterium]
MTSKQRSVLKGIAMTTDPIFQIGKSGLTDEFIAAIEEALVKRELIKIHVLKSNDDDKMEIANAIAEATDSIVVQVIGSMIVLFKYQHDPKKRKIDI